MSQQSLHAFYEPNLRLNRAYGLLGYNAGYAENRKQGSFDQYQKNLVWRLLGDTTITEKSVVLDVGCGIGGPSSWIFERYRPARLFGLEFCPSSVRVAEKQWSGRSPRPRFIHGDAHRIPLPTDSIDVIFNLESALHYADKSAFIAECHRVLKPGGVLCLGDICTRWRRLFRCFQLLDRVAGQFSTQASLWSPEQYLDAFKSQQLELLRHEDVTKGASDSLHVGLSMVVKGGWKAAAGFRGRFFYLSFVEWLLRYRFVSYDLFNVVKK